MKDLVVHYDESGHVIGAHLVIDGEIHAFPADVPIVSVETKWANERRQEAKVTFRVDRVLASEVTASPVEQRIGAA